jgi:hypothetical protein
MFNIAIGFILIGFVNDKFNTAIGYIAIGFIPIRFILLCFVWAPYLSPLGKLVNQEFNLKKADEI